jgi:hypothetical protein
MHKNATKCNETIGKWCKNKHGASKIIDTFETYQASFVPLVVILVWVLVVLLIGIVYTCQVVTCCSLLMPKPGCDVKGACTMGVGIGKKITCVTYVEEGIFIFEEMGQLGKQRVTL